MKGIPKSSPQTKGKCLPLTLCYTNAAQSQPSVLGPCSDIILESLSADSSHNYTMSAWPILMLCYSKVTPSLIYLRGSPITIPRISSVSLPLLSMLWSLQTSKAWLPMFLKAKIYPPWEGGAFNKVGQCTVA